MTYFKGILISRQDMMNKILTVNKNTTTTGNTIS